MKKPKSAGGCTIASRVELPSKPVWCQLCALLLSLTFPLATIRAESQSWISGRVFWDDFSANWLSAEDETVWSNGSEAIFNSGTGIVLVGSTGIAASSLLFRDSVTIADGRLTLTGNATIDAADGVIASIAAGLTGSAGISVGSQSGTGTIILAGNNDYTGTTVVEAGAWLGAQSSSALGSAEDETRVEAGATLSLGDVTIVGESLTISGQGSAGSDGALHVDKQLRR